MKYLFFLFIITTSFAQQEHIYYELNNGSRNYISDINEAPYLMCVLHDTVNFSFSGNRKIVQAKGDTVSYKIKTNFLGYKNFDAEYQSVFKAGYLDLNSGTVMILKNRKESSSFFAIDLMFLILLLFWFGYCIQKKTYFSHDIWITQFSDSVVSRFTLLFGWLFVINFVFAFLSSSNEVLIPQKQFQYLGLFFMYLWILIFVSNFFIENEKKMRNFFAVSILIACIVCYFVSDQWHWFILPLFYWLGILVQFLFSFKSVRSERKRIELMANR